MRTAVVRQTAEWVAEATTPFWRGASVLGRDLLPGQVERVKGIEPSTRSLGSYSKLADS
jgi:hypothetical protein